MTSKLLCRRTDLHDAHIVLVGCCWRNKVKLNVQVEC